MKFSKDRQWLFLFILIAIAARFSSFFPSVLDHDESTYMIIGRDILHGKSLYVDDIDSKPVGIFLIYALMQLIFGYSIFLKRLFVSIIVGLTSWLLKKVSVKFFQNERVAIASGLIYIFYNSIWTKIGVSPNTETFFNLFTIGALLLFFTKDKVHYWVAGLLLGLGFIIKYLVLFDFIAISSFFLFLDLKKNNWKISSKQITPYILSGVGFAMPFLLVNIYFYLGDHFEAFRFITYEFPERYRVGTTLLNYILLFLDFLARFLPVSYLLFYAIFINKFVFKGWQKQFFIYWIIAILIAIYLPGKQFTHYAIQLMLPFSLVAAVAFHPDFKFDKFTSKLYTGKTSVILLVILITVLQGISVVSKVSDPRKPRKIAEYLEKNMGKDDTVYLSNSSHIVYYLLKRESPTPYVHATILSNPLLSHAFNVDPETEIERIFAEKPQFVVVKPPFEIVEEAVSANYKLDTTFVEGRVEVYKLNE